MGVEAAIFWVVLTFAGALFIAHTVPAWVKTTHVRSQNRILDHCRALFLQAVQAVERGDTASARKMLRFIRRAEWGWKLGDSYVFRVALFVNAVFLACLACVILRFCSFFLSGMGNRINSPDFGLLLLTDLWIAVLMSMMAPVYAAMAYMETWRDPHRLNNLAARLEQLLNGGRGLIFTETYDFGLRDGLDGLTPYEVFGISPGFTKAQLDAARRRLVREFHPDRWHSEGEVAREAAEAAMKRVNAAYDQLKPRAV